MTSNGADNAEKPAGDAPKPALFRIVEGVNIPSLFEVSCERPMEEHVQLLKALEMRPDDVMLVAFGKSGTHWIWEVVSMLLSGKAEYEKRTKEFAMMEATKIEKLADQPSPRVFNTHLPFTLLPRQIKEKRIKVIHVYRNCKDVVVSGYFHVRQMMMPKPFTLKDMFDKMVSPEVKGGNYFTYHKDMDDYKKNNPDIPFFTMSFEDSKEDPEKVVGNLAEFLGVKASPELCKGIAEATHIRKMREADKTKQQRSNLPQVEMYRKGEVGDWKNHLTVAQSESLDAAMTYLESCDYNFRYTL